MELPPDPSNNPHLRAQLRRDRSAPERFEAGPQTKKARQIESVAVGVPLERQGRGYAGELTLSGRTYYTVDGRRYEENDHINHLSLSHQPERLHNEWFTDHINTRFGARPYVEGEVTSYVSVPTLALPRWALGFGRFS